MFLRDPWYLNWARARIADQTNMLEFSRLFGQRKSRQYTVAFEVAVSQFMGLSLDWASRSGTVVLNYSTYLMNYFRTFP